MPTKAPLPAVILDADTIGELFDELRALRSDLEAILSPDGRTAEAHNPDPRIWVSNAQLMQELRVSKPTLARWRQSGALPYAKVGGIVFYRRSDVYALLERHLRDAASGATEEAE